MYLRKKKLLRLLHCLHLLCKKREIFKFKSFLKFMKMTEANNENGLTRNQVLSIGNSLKDKSFFKTTVTDMKESFENLNETQTLSDFKHR